METSRSLSLFHKILILAEDRGEIGDQDLALFGSSRQMIGALGRLEGLRYLDRKKNKAGDTFLLTNKGDEVLADMLASLPDKNEQWDHKWRFIILDIPESRRTLRQMFRLKLLDLGARMLQSSVWITPHTSLVETVQVLVEHERAQHYVHFFEAKTLGSTFLNISHLWDLNSLKKEYKHLFDSFKKDFPKISTATDPVFSAKCMIMELALVSKKDPRLPAEFMPDAWIGLDAKEWYHKIRAFCR